MFSLEIFVNGRDREFSHRSSLIQPLIPSSCARIFYAMNNRNTDITEQPNPSKNVTAAEVHNFFRAGYML